MSGIWQELKRRNVFRVAVAYLAASWLALQILQLVVEGAEAPAWIMKVMLALAGIGFPLAIGFSWAYELTPEGLKREKEVDRSASITPQTGQRLDRVIIALLAVAVVYFVWERQAHDHSAEAVVDPVAATGDPSPAEARPEAPPEPVATSTVRNSIAVLPFVNMSSDQEQEYFADGLTEEILNSLAKTPDLLVAARTSSFAFKGTNQPITEIADALGVGHVLEGSVRRGGDTLRITAQLIRANDGFHLWSETFDRTMEDIIVVQEEIAVQIARALDTAMDPEALKAMMAVGTNSVAAYNEYLTGVGLGRAALNVDPYEALNARDAFERAIELDPEFAEAWFEVYQFWLSETEPSQVLSGLVELPLEDKLRERRTTLSTAIRLQKNRVDNLRYRGYDAWETNQSQLALSLFSEYVEARPNDPEGLGPYLYALRELGRYTEATEFVRQRMATSEPNFDLTHQYLQTVRTPADTDLMRELATMALERFGDDAGLVYQAHRQLLYAMDIDEAGKVLARIQNSVLPVETILYAEMRQLCAENRTDEARAHLARIRTLENRRRVEDWLPLKILGEDEEAEALLAEVDAEGDISALKSYLSYPAFDATPFPNLLAAYEGQGLEDREVISLPFRCGR
jgi:TolB-like protein/tetratricopeptide (TPR) repeat protein